MDRGAPSPTIISNDTELFISFYVDKPTASLEPQERNVIYDIGIIGIKFKLYLKYTFGLPGNETLQSHPYNKLGIRSFSFYELNNSNLIRELEGIDKMHPYYDAKKWRTYKHYVLTFHDNMFECIAKDFEIREENTSLYDQSVTILREISADQF